MKIRITLLLSGLLLAACLAKAQQPAPPGGQPPPPGEGQRPSPEEHLKQVTNKLQKDLTLTPAQQAKVEAAYKSFFASAEKVRGGKMQPPPPPPPPPGSKKSMDSLSVIRDATIKKALTSAQFIKYKEIEKTMRPPARQGPPPPRP